MISKAMTIREVIEILATEDDTLAIPVLSLIHQTDPTGRLMQSIEKVMETML